MAMLTWSIARRFLSPACKDRRSEVAPIPTIDGLATPPDVIASLEARIKTIQINQLENEATHVRQIESLNLAQENAEALESRIALLENDKREAQEEQARLKVELSDARAANLNIRNMMNGKLAKLTEKAQEAEQISFDVEGQLRHSRKDTEKSLATIDALNNGSALQASRIHTSSVKLRVNPSPRREPHSPFPTSSSTLLQPEREWQARADTEASGALC